MPADTSVKLFHSGMAGAPVLSGTAGALIAVLDACLVNGFGSGTADSLVIAGGVATVTRSAGHPFEVDSVAEIAGASVTGGSVNGEQKVLSITSTTYTFDATGIPNQTATGTITHKLASAGWSKAFSGTNLAAYRSSDVTGLRFYCRVDDTGTTNARARGYEAMTDINTGTGLFPTDTLVSGGVWWGKSGNADTNARRWIIVADKKFFYVIDHWLNSATATNFTVLGAFGDLAGRAGTDQYAALCFGSVGNQTASTPGALSTDQLTYISSSTLSNASTPRPNTGLGGASGTVRAYPMLSLGSSGIAESGATSSGHIQFPNSADSGLYLAPVQICSAANGGTCRGRLPGLFAVPQTVGATVFTHMQTITGVEGYPGRKFDAINSSSGVSFFDVTGPWT
jgi:hypothetical protein